MHTISIDVETYSSNDLNKCGVYKSVQAPDFDILLFGYAVDGGAVQVVDLAAGEEIPVDVLAALSDESITKWAFNSNFERICLSEWLRRKHPEYFISYSIMEDTVGDYLDPHGWKCSTSTSLWLYALNSSHFSMSCSGRFLVLPPLLLVALHGTQK